ncbi:5-hydroxytryptamine receptor 3A-like isoform X4 [Halichoeres trimaculatus]|uniref:5-hydroxytryptamine receptor 3A-like isoform X4 n=2 Tax=Halichoeres trimaculatus TaxID=147232 RepID=UPI003D9FA017
MFAGFLFLLLLTGGSSSNHTQPPDAEGPYNQSHLDGESSSNHTQSPDDEYDSEEDTLSKFLKPPTPGGEGTSTPLSEASAPSAPTSPTSSTSSTDTHCAAPLAQTSGGSSSNHTQPPDDQYDSEEGDWPDHCNYTNIVNYFHLSDKVKFYWTRPTKHIRSPTNVMLFINLYSILDVKEKEQELVSYFWMMMWWENKFINWKPRDFCETYEITAPTELLWKPDLTIEEVTNKDKLFNTQYLTMRFNGWINQKSGMVLVSTCKMDFYRFPFDTQICNLTFKSIQHELGQIQLRSGIPNGYMLKDTRAYMKTESEWLLMNVTVETTMVFKFNIPSSMLVYTMTIKRRSVLYVANFIVPVLFFLCLDLASFLISESGDRIPLIAVYCIGVFTLMMLSLLETILMMYLMEKDHVSQDQEADKDQSLGEDYRDQAGKVHECFRDMNKSIPCVRVFDQSPAGMPPELLPEVKEGSSSQLTQEIQDLQNLSDELREVLKTVVLLLSSRKEEEDPGYWTRKTKTLNRIYFIVYLLAASVFLGSVFSVWLHEDHQNI